VCGILNVHVLDFGQCDGKKCTGKKLSRLHVLKELRMGQGWNGLILSPTGAQAVSPSDRYAVWLCVVVEHYKHF
jgi:ribosome biogenesis protein Tsr3